LWVRVFEKGHSMRDGYVEKRKKGRKGGRENEIAMDVECQLSLCLFFFAFVFNQRQFGRDDDVKCSV